MPKKIFIISLLLFLILELSYGQDRTAKFGIVFMEDFSSKPLDYGVAFWINNNFSIELLGGFESMEIRDNSGTLYTIGIGGIYHIGEKIIVPFIGARFLYANVYNDDESYSDFMFGIVFGAEHYFTDYISLGLEFQLNFIETDKDFSPTNNAVDAHINRTGRYIILRFYL